jgi:beta-glucoside operon transcriptional antiterminator
MWITPHEHRDRPLGLTTLPVIVDEETAVHVKSVFNNNAALVVDNNEREVVVMGKGLAFQKRPGDRIDSKRVERQFLPAPSTSVEQLATFFNQIPIEDILLAQQIIELAQGTLATGVDQRIIIPLADHISFALQRERQGTTIQYPLAWEITHLYPAEVALGRRALDLIERQTHVRLPDVEAAPLALHFVNSQLGSSNLSQVVEMTEMLGRILDLIRYDYLTEIDEGALNTTRFVTHLRFLFLRQYENQPDTLVEPSLRESVRSSDPKAYRCAEKILDLLQAALGWNLTDSEALYLALHIHRLMAQGRN